MRTCRKCGVAKPATSDFFDERCYRGGLRLLEVCRSCSAPVAPVAPAPIASMPTEFHCHLCGCVRPSWYRNRSRADCRGCAHFSKLVRTVRAVEDDRRREVERMFARAVELRRKREDGVITCRVCAGEFPVSLAWRNKTNGSIESVCLSCKRLDGRLRRQIQKAEQLLDPSKTVRRAIRRGINAPSFSALVGYSIEDLRRHLERQFVDGMTWDAFDRGEIHIDHIVPQRDFDLRDPAEFRSCWSLGNLRPLWAGDNLSKLGKRIYLI